MKINDCKYVYIQKKYNDALNASFVCLEVYDKNVSERYRQLESAFF